MSRTTVQINDLGAAPGFSALQNHPNIDHERYYIHPECMFGGGGFVAADVEELAVWSSLTAEGTWAAYESDGTQGGDQPVVSSSATVRTTGKNTIQVAWDPNGTAQQSQYVDYPLATLSNSLARRNYVRIWTRSNGTMAAGELTLSFLDANGAVIGSAINFPAIGTANVWFACEFNIQSIRAALVQSKPGPHYIRITNTNSAAADTTLFFNPIAYDISNGTGPVFGHVLKLTADAARARGTIMRCQPGYEHTAVVGASNSVANFGPVVEGWSSATVGSTNVAFAAPASAGDPVWVQVTGICWPTCGAGGGTIWYPVSLTSSVTVDDEEAVGQSMGTFIETATAGGNYAVNLSGFASGGGGGGVAFANVVRDNAANTVEAAFSITGEAGTGAGAGADIVMTGGAGGPTDGTGGPLTFTAGDGTAAGNGGQAVWQGGDSGAGATGDGGQAILRGGAAASTNGAGGAATAVGGAATGTGTGGLATLQGGDSAGAGGTAGGVSIDSGAATGGTGADVNIGNSNASGVNIGRPTFPTIIMSGATEFFTDFLGVAVDPALQFSNGGGAGAAAAMTVGSSRGIATLSCGTANGATAWAIVDMLSGHFDPANGDIYMVVRMSMSSIANGRFTFGFTANQAGVAAAPAAYVGDYAVATLIVGTSANWYVGGDAVAPADSSIAATASDRIYMLKITTAGNITLYVFDPANPDAAPSTFTSAAGCSTGSAMLPFVHVSYEDANSRSILLDSLRIYQE